MVTDPVADVLSQTDVVVVRMRDGDNDVDEMHRKADRNATKFQNIFLL